MKPHRRKLTAKQRRRRNFTAALRRAAHVAAGRRCDGKPLAPVKPCGCRTGSCIKCVKTPRHRAREKLLKKAHAEYSNGLSLCATALKYKLNRGALRASFRVRGLPIRQMVTPPKLGFGVKIPPLTETEIQATINGLKRLAVPRSLKLEWRSWNVDRRRDWILRARAHLEQSGRIRPLPSGPYSTNVKPFDYCSAEARAIVARRVRGKDYRTKQGKLKPVSTGLIYKGQLWYWNGRLGYAGWHRSVGKKFALHHVIYQEHYGPIPSAHTVIFKDGNKNNHTPSNLTLRSRAQCAEINHWKHLAAPRRNAIVSRLHDGRDRARIVKSRERAALMVKNFNQPQANVNQLLK